MPLDKDLTEFTTTSQLIASYAFEDLEEGTYVLLLYGGQDNTGWYLTKNAGLASKNMFSTISASSTWGENKFAIKFNEPKTLKGNIFVNVPISRGSGNSALATVTIKIYHWDGSTETQLGSTTSDTTPTTAAESTDETEILSIKVPITTEKLFASGDVFRLGVKVVVGNNDYQIGHDPLNRSSGAAPMISSQLKCFTPFKLE